MTGGAGDRGRGREGHGLPESGPPGGLVEVLARWEQSGGHWEILGSSEDWIDFGLLDGDSGEQTTRVRGARTSVLRGYLAGRTGSRDRDADRG